MRPGGRRGAHDTAAGAHAQRDTPKHVTAPGLLQPQAPGTCTVCASPCAESVSSRSLRALLFEGVGWWAGSFQCATPGHFLSSHWNCRRRRRGVSAVPRPACVATDLQGVRGMSRSGDCSSPYPIYGPYPIYIYFVIHCGKVACIPSSKTVKPCIVFANYHPCV